MQLEAIASCHITCYLAEETHAHLATTSLQVVVDSTKVSPQPPLLQTKQPQFPQLLLWLDHSPASLSFSGYAPAPQCLPCSKGPKNEYSIQGAASPVPEYRGMITALLLLATLFLTQARIPLTFLATWAHCWLMFSQLSTSTPRSFSTGQLSSHSSPSL